MHEVTISLTDAQWKAMSIATPDPAEWVKSAAEAYANRQIEEVFMLEVQRMASDSSVTQIPADKDAVVMASTLPTAVERNAATLAMSPWLNEEEAS